MTHSAKSALFLFEALGSLACGFYGNYVFFLFRDRYGFGDLENLSVAALMGLVIAISSWQGGRFAQRQGLLKAIYLGQVGLIISLVGGALLPSLISQLAVLVLWTASQFIVWPAVEALVTEGDAPKARARRVGVYSVVWASCSAWSYFFGGTIFERLGSQSIFWLPPGIHLVQILIVWAYTKTARASGALPLIPRPEDTRGGIAGSSSISPQTFQRMAWLANPFASIASFTVLAMIPGLAQHLGLSTGEAGWICSIWFFARLAAFLVLWRWPGWHYRFRWMWISFVGLIAGFAVILASRSLVPLCLGQVGFGIAVGFMYYASLFYSMDVGESRAEHGGIHEAAMGLGNFVGPGIGALGLLVAPRSSHASMWAVSGLLVLGLGIMVRIRFRESRKGEQRSVTGIGL